MNDFTRKYWVGVCRRATSGDDGGSEVPEIVGNVLVVANGIVHDAELLVWLDQRNRRD